MSDTISNHFFEKLDLDLKDSFYYRIKCSDNSPTNIIYDIMEFEHGSGYVVASVMEQGGFFDQTSFMELKYMYDKEVICANCDKLMFDERQFAILKQLIDLSNKHVIKKYIENE